jgi:hypothetical protein
MHDQLEQQFIRHLRHHTKMSEKLIRDTVLGPSDAFLTAEECLKYGICDEIRDPFARDDDGISPVLTQKAKAKRKPRQKAVSETPSSQ